MPEHLGYLAARSGLEPVDLRDDVLPKEISMLAKPGIATGVLPDPRRGWALAVTTVRWLRNVMVAAGAGRDRKSVVSGKSVSVRVDLGGRRCLKKKQKSKR